MSADQKIVESSLHPVVRRIENFRFDLGDKIIVREIQRPGIVDSLTVDNLGRQYRVVYWNDGTRKSEWMYEWELELRAIP